MSTNEDSPLQNLATIPLEEITPLFSKQVVIGEKQMVVWANLKKDGRAATHAHKEEQTFWVTSGSMEVRMQGKCYLCCAGAVLTVPSWVEHEAIAMEDMSFVSFLSGVRKDLVGTEVPEHFKDASPVIRS